MSPLSAALGTVRDVEPIRVSGSVAVLRGLTLLVDHLPLTVGSVVEVHPASAGPLAPKKFGEVVGFDHHRAVVMMLGATAGVRPGDRVVGLQASPTIAVGQGMLGRVVDGLGRPLDSGPPMAELTPRPLHPAPLSAMHRRRINTSLPTGVRAIDLMTTVGRGQRLGIFAGPGVGKSTLLGMIARRTAADVNVIALIGERGREVRDFIEESLGPQGLARSIVVVSTGDESPLMRLRAALVACTAAEFFRDRGLDVMLMLDSVTRLAQAQRQIGLAVGEPPATKGYTPSVFSLLPILLERAGAVEGKAGAKGGSVTGFYTILVEGDDMTEPISDAARGILDGHLVLSRGLAHKAHFPAIDVLASASRVMRAVTSKDHQNYAGQIKEWMALYNQAEDLINIGAYAKGSNVKIDQSIAVIDRINALLRQTVDEKGGFDMTLAQMQAIVRIGENAAQTAASRAR